MGRCVPSTSVDLLNALGLNLRGEDGFRLYPGGEPLTMLIEHGAHAPDLEPASELIGEYPKDVGIKVTVKKFESTLWVARRNNNVRQATIFWAHDQGWDDNWTNDTIQRAGYAWWVYLTQFSDSVMAMEPPLWVLDSFELDR